MPFRPNADRVFFQSVSTKKQDIFTHINTLCHIAELPAYSFSVLATGNHTSILKLLIVRSTRMGQYDGYQFIQSFPMPKRTKGIFNMSGFELEK